MATGTIESNDLDGTTTAALPLSGQYRIDVSGTYTNRDLNIADAECTNLDLDSSWTTHTDGYDVGQFLLGEGFGDVQVNGAFVNWGALSSSHAYSLSTTLNGSVNLAVFDGDSNTNIKGPANWYDDNSGSLNYAITYLGL